MNQDDETPEVEAEETTAEAVVDAPDQAEVDPPADELVIGFEGEAEAEDEPVTPKVRLLREELKATKRRLKEIEAATAAQEQAKEAPPATKPTIADAGYDDDKLVELVEAWTRGEMAREAKAKAEAEKRKADEDAYQASLTAYVEKKKALTVPDYADAEDAVRSALSPAQQSIIVANLLDPAKFVYALGKSPAKLAELAAMTRLDQFTAAAVRMEATVKVEQRKTPPPETKLPGSAAGGNATSSANLTAMKQKAEATGDYTAYFAAKRAAKAAGQAA